MNTGNLRGSFDKEDEQTFQTKGSNPYARPPDPAHVVPSRPFEQGPDNEYGVSLEQIQTNNSNRSKRSLLSRISRRSQRTKDEKDYLSDVIEEDENATESSDDDEVVPDLTQIVNRMHDEKNTQKTANMLSKNDRDDARSTARKRINRMAKENAESKLVTKMRSVYGRFLSKTLITRIFVYWFPLALVLFVPLAVGAWKKPRPEVGHTSLMWLFIWIEIIWGSLWVARILAHYLPVAIAAFLAVFSPLWVKYTSIFSAMEMPVAYVLWTFISFITFTPLLSDNHGAWSEKASYSQSWQKTVNNIMVSFFIVSLVYFCENLLIYFLAVSFHRTRFAARIKSNKNDIKFLGVLLHAAYAVFPPFCEEFRNEDLELAAGLTTNISHKVAANTPVNVGKVVGNVNRAIGGAVSLVGKAVQDISPTKDEHRMAQNVVDQAIIHKVTSKILAGRIWKSLVLEDEEELSVEDVVDVLGEEKRGQIETVFEKIDIDGNHSLTLEEMELSIVNTSQEKKTIYRSLQDVNSAIKSLHKVLLFVVGIISVIIFIGMLAPNGAAVLATLGTTILGLSFIFASTAQEIVAGCVFLFVKHPYDVGDIVTLALPAGPTKMKVQEMSLLYSTFTDMSNGLFHQCPNAVLTTQWVDNITRTGSWSEPFTFILGLPETRLEQIDQFKQLVEEFCATNKRDYLPTPWIFVTNMPDIDRISLTVNVSFRSTGLEASSSGTRKEKLIQFLGQAIHDIPLLVPRRDETNNNPSLPIYSQPLTETTAEAAIQKGASGSLESNRIPVGFRSQDDEIAVTETGVPVDTARSTAINRAMSVSTRTSALSRTKSKGMRRH